MSQRLQLRSAASTLLMTTALAWNLPVAAQAAPPVAPPAALPAPPPAAVPLEGAPVRGTAPRGAFGGSQGTAPTAPASAAASGAAAAGTARQTGATMTT